MEKKIMILQKFSSFKIVLFYTTVSAVYIFTSDYFLELLIPNINLLSKLQTIKGLAFILITAILLYILVKRNIYKISSYYQEIIDIKQLSDKQSIQSTEEYISLFNHSPLPMWLFDTETLRFILVNEAACSHYGFSQEEYMSMTLKDIRPKEDILLLEEMLALSLKTNSSLSTIVRHQKKNGEIIQVKVKTCFVAFNGKKLRLASAVDITAEMNTQKKLTESNSRLQIASEIASLGYWTNDLVKSEIQWSDEMHRIFETDPKTFELTLEAIVNRFHPDERLKFNTQTFSNFDEKNIIESEQRIITDSGKIKWILERIHLIKDHNNVPIKLEGIAVDITKRKLHEQEIWESNERFKLLTKATIEAIIDWDIDSKTVFWGDGFHSLLGYDLSKTDNRLWSSNIHPEDRKKVLSNLNRALKDPTKQNFNAEFRFLKANRDVAYVQHRSVLIRDINGKVTRVLGAMIDLTDTLERMRKIEMQNKVLKDISWTQSHMARAPLANILGLINLMKDNKSLGINDENLIDYISESANKLDDIIRDIVKKSAETNNIE
ncbi:PAS domain-containing protein [Flavobacterium sp. UBA7682]|uniref:PAS domain-containing protein n=1 Tax=Flavobacterium sp. UBA7682 TaxID=1946560 RepID=UPI0025C606B3|nr:PAS domain-containing protein [Flavobacterium sp. UBA7682]